MPTVNDPYARINRLLVTAERNIRQVFTSSVIGLRDELDLGRLANLIERGDFESALDLVLGTAEKLGSASTVHFVNAGENTAAFLSDAGVATISFDRVNMRAVEAMRANQLRLITEFTDTQRRAVREVLEQGIARGLGPVEQARGIRETIGLTEKQTRAVTNYRRLLEKAGNSDIDRRKQREALTRALRDKRFDGSVKRAIREQKTLTKKQIDTMVGRYRDKSIKHRGEVISRTESIRSVHEGINETYEQAYESGKINPDDVTEKWNSAGDGRTRDSHARLNGTTKKVEELWQVSSGTLRFPCDPSGAASETVNCRCVVTRRIRRILQGDLGI